MSTKKLFCILTGVVFVSSLFLLGKAMAGPAGVVPSAPGAGKLVDIIAGTMSKDIYLKPKDGPAYVDIRDWYCPVGDQPIDLFAVKQQILTAMPDFEAQMNSSKQHKSSSNFYKKHMVAKNQALWIDKATNDYRRTKLRESFPNIIFEKDPIRSPALDAPPGSSKFHVLRNHCYIKNELMTMKDLILNELKRLWNEKQIQI